MHYSVMFCSLEFEPSPASERGIIFAEIFSLPEGATKNGNFRSTNSHHSRAGA
ncbi:hypothetical protein [Coxiella burnetii]|uniref:hypothetical protein n=1 Tax=Coxiella burnetii TaxID=777 RepID=UPI000183D0B1|nr:hypothetical protein [Coxiella burnetii]ACJ17683.1 hypothetical protein CbuG_0242 [Coxiella burnetii CbuG_Q212]ATN66136.1 hypothetical protein AYM17_01140 [Coxiella burnetii]OYK86962.1 hypothetical protein CbuQ229_01215 [Coxiella burnetii]